MKQLFKYLISIIMLPFAIVLTVLWTISGFKIISDMKYISWFGIEFTINEKKSKQEKEFENFFKKGDK